MKVFTFVNKIDFLGMCVCGGWKSDMNSIHISTLEENISLFSLGYCMGILIFCTVGSFHVRHTSMQVTAGNCKTVHNRLTSRLDIIDSGSLDAVIHSLISGLQNLTPHVWNFKWILSGI